MSSTRVIGFGVLFWTRQRRGNVAINVAMIMKKSTAITLALTLSSTMLSYVVISTNLSKYCIYE